MNKKIRILGMAARLAWFVLFCFQAAALGQTQTAAVAQTPEPIESVKETPSPPADESLDSMFPHFGDERPFWVSGQMNFISQAHPEFPAAYSGKNSFVYGLRVHVEL